MDFKLFQPGSRNPSTSESLGIPRKGCCWGNRGQAHHARTWPKVRPINKKRKKEGRALWDVAYHLGRPLPQNQVVEEPLASVRRGICVGKGPLFRNLHRKNIPLKEAKGNGGGHEGLAHHLSIWGKRGLTLPTKAPGRTLPGGGRFRGNPSERPNAPEPQN